MRRTAQGKLRSPVEIYVHPVPCVMDITRDIVLLFNEVLRGLYGEIGRVLGDPEKSDATEKAAKTLGVKFNKPKPPGRFDPNAE